MKYVMVRMKLHTCAKAATDEMSAVICEARSVPRASGMYAEH